MKVLSIAIVCGFCGKVIEVEGISQRVEGIDTIGVVRHECEQVNG